MPKHKTRKTIAKRFKITSKGKLMHYRQNDQHRKSHKKKRTIRTYHRPKMLGMRESKLMRSLIIS